MQKNKIAQCLCQISQQLPTCETSVIQQLNNVATEFNQIVITETQTIVSQLQKALADEICAAYQYWSAYNMTRGTGKIDVDPQFDAHSEEQWEHAELLIERIKQLDGFPQTNLKQVFELCKSHAACGAQSHNVCELLSITIEAEKDAIETYKNIIKMTAQIDPTTHQIAKKILADEEEHLYDLKILKEDICN